MNKTKAYVEEYLIDNDYLEGSNIYTGNDPKEIQKNLIARLTKIRNRIEGIEIKFDSYNKDHASGYDYKRHIDESFDEMRKIVNAFEEQMNKFKGML